MYHKSRIILFTIYVSYIITTRGLQMTVVEINSTDLFKNIDLFRIHSLLTSSVVVHSTALCKSFTELILSKTLISLRTKQVSH